MSSRILMATVAAIALAVPAAAQEQAKPLQPEQDATQQLEGDNVETNIDAASLNLQFNFGA